MRSSGQQGRHRSDARHAVHDTAERRWIALGLAAALVVVIAGGWIAWQAATESAIGAALPAASRSEVDTGTSQAPPASDARRQAIRESQAWPSFAHVGSLHLTLPNPGVKAVAYHQASYDDALPLVPMGHLLKNYGGRLFHAPPDSLGPRYIVQPQRAGRTTGATTAVDIVAPSEMDIYPPVTGTVVRVKRYKLYGRYPDIEIEIKPKDDPGYRVVMIHVDHVVVNDGDKVSATLSVIGTPREFPFHSVVNDYVGGSEPHVHLEVKDAS